MEFLLDQAALCPVTNPPPMTMIINIPERVLLIKVTCLAGSAGKPIGYVLVFYDITEFVSADDASSVRPGVRRRLTKIPTVANQRIVFVDADDILSIHSDGHYTRVVTASANRFCNLSIGDIESRLDPDHFMRVHRGHIVNLRAVAQLLRKEGRLALQLEEAPEPIPVSRTNAGALLERLGVPLGKRHTDQASGQPLTIVFP